MCVFYTFKEAANAFLRTLSVCSHIFIADLSMIMIISYCLIIIIIKLFIER